MNKDVNYKIIQHIIKECVETVVNEKLNDNINSSNMNKYLENIKYLYHATPICYVNSIKKYGLGGKIPNIRFWNYEGTPYEHITQGCFLATDEYVAESYVENSEAFEELSDMYEDRYDKELEIVVFGINVSDLNFDLISLDSNQQLDSETDPTFFYNGVIPYNKLIKVKL